MVLVARGLDASANPAIEPLRMQTQAFVVADDPVYADWLRTTVATTDFSPVRSPDVADLLGRLEFAGRPDLLCIEFRPDQADARAQMIEDVAERFPDLPIVGLGVDHDPALVLAAMRAGARDFFVLHRDEAKVAVLIGKLLRRSGGVVAGRGGPQGLLASVMAAHPGDGIAFLAEHLALACQDQAPRQSRVLLLDLATPAGASSVFLKLSSGYGVLDAIRDVQRCDATLVDTAFPRHASGLYVLSLPEDLLGVAPIDADALLRLIDLLRGLFANIVLAIDGFASLRLLGAIIDESGRSLLLTDQSVLGSRQSQHLLRGLRAQNTPLDRLGLVVDRVRYRPGLEPDALAKLLGLPLLAALGGDGALRLQAMNAGEPLFKLAPRDPYAVDARSLATSLFSQPPLADEPARGLLGRLFRQGAA